MKSEFELLSAAYRSRYRILRRSYMEGSAMAANAEKAARNFCLSTLQNNVRVLQDKYRKKEADPDYLEFNHEALRKAWEEYIT